MSSFIGPWGQLVEFKCPSALEVSSESRSSFATTLGGRVVEQRGPRGRRTWQASIATATPDQVAGLQALAMGAMGSPPWVWVSPDAQSQNLLSPDVSVFLPGTYSNVATLAGSAKLSDGTFLPAIISLPAGGFTGIGATDQVPVIRGIRITASVYSAGIGRIDLIFLNSSGSIVESVTAYSAVAWGRRAISALPPVGAVSCYLRAEATTGSLRIAAPALTWTDSSMPWSVGRGCPRATVDGLSESLQLAVRDNPGMNRSAYQFTVKELG